VDADGVRLEIMTGAKYDGQASRETSSCSTTNVSGRSNAWSSRLAKSSVGVLFIVSTPLTSESEHSSFSASSACDQLER
jgi:hypothetical protein